MKYIFTGLAGSGKDTCADYLQEAHPELSRDAFARRMKVFCKTLFFNSTDEHWDGELKEVPTTLKISKITYREAEEYFNSTYGKVEGLGYTEVMLLLGIGFKEKGSIDTSTPDLDYQVKETSPREILQYLGTEVLRAKVPTVHTDVLFIEGEPNLITDGRFKDEIAVSKARGYTVVKVYNPHKASRAKSHVSEAGIPDELCDIIIVNDGTLEELKTKVLSSCK